jgi:hypothetical protein
MLNDVIMTILIRPAIFTIGYRRTKKPKSVCYYAIESQLTFYIKICHVIIIHVMEPLKESDALRISTETIQAQFC